MSFEVANAPPRLLPEGEVLCERYRVGRRLGRGGMGEVYEATHTRTGAAVAIKVLLSDYSSNPDVVTRFIREAEITSKLHHPNIVKVFDFDRLPHGQPFLAMEMLMGSELAALMTPGRGLPLARVGTIVAQACSALAAAHAVGVIHRDLKPANLFLEKLAGTDQDMVRVLDFGISKVRDMQTVTKVSTLVGTPHYMSPEQATGGHVDGRSDQFALAAVVHEMLTGRPAFAGQDPAEGDAAPAVLFRVVHQDPPSFASFGLRLPAVETVLKRALAKNRGDRFPDIHSFATAFEGAVREDTSATRSSSKARDTVALPSSSERIKADWARNDTLRVAAGETRALPTPPLGSKRVSRPLLVSLGIGAGLGALGLGFFLFVARTPFRAAPSAPESVSAARPTSVPLPPPLPPAEAKVAEEPPAPANESEPAAAAAAAPVEPAARRDSVRDRRKKGPPREPRAREKTAPGEPSRAATTGSLHNEDL